MDDIDTRLESERPDVADVLKSMNWEERLAEARARRSAALKKGDKADRRPVVRIVDAAAMAQRRAQAKPAALPALHEPSPAAPQAEPAPAEVPAVAAAEAAPAQAAGNMSLAGRTALGFGLGLGLGMSVLVGLVMFAGWPGVLPAPRSDTAAGGGDAAIAALPAAEPAPGVGTRVSAPPLLFVSSPIQGPVPAPDVSGPASPSQLTALPHSIGAAPTLPAAVTADAAFAAAVVPVGPATSLRDPRLAAAPTPVAAPVVPAQEAEGSAAVVRPAALATARAESAPTRTVVPYRPASEIPSVALARIDVAIPATKPPADAPAPLPVALPAGPFASASPERAPALSVSPPAPPDTSPPLGHPHIPHGDGLFVRIVVPETVPDAEAEHLAGLLTSAGAGESRISRVGFKVSDTHLRFYHAKDADAAAAIADLTGTEARDFTSFRPSPPDGTIEVFIAGERASPPPRPAAPKRARAQPPDELTRMRDRIVDRMRRGEHL